MRESPGADRADSRAPDDQFRAHVGSEGRREGGFGRAPPRASSGRWPLAGRDTPRPPRRPPPSPVSSSPFSLCSVFGREGGDVSGVQLGVARGRGRTTTTGGNEGRARTLSRSGDDRLRLLLGGEQLLDAVARVHRARRRAFRRSEGKRARRSMRLAVRCEEVGGARGGGRRDVKQGKFDGPAEGRVLSIELLPGELV